VTGLKLAAKAAREMGAATLLISLGLCAFHIAIAFIIPFFATEMMEQWLQLKLVQQLLAAFLGADVGTAFGPAVLNVMEWAHPIVIALVSACAVMCCTRTPAGEVDRGTIDVLLALPIRRTTAYSAEAVVWSLGGLLLVGLGLVGHVLGREMAEQKYVYGASSLILVSANLYCLYLATAGMASFFSTLCDRRGWAVGLSVAVLLASLFLSSFSSFNSVMKKLSVLSVMNYYRPFRILQGNASPLSDMIVLLAIGTGLWICGGLVFTRRDIRTV
jgi:ABC-type transport system involved in multi-copper enzyme maturation permease subunit